MIRLALALAASLFATPTMAQDGVDRYQLDLSVRQAGVEIVSTRTQIIEDAPASASATIGGVTYSFEANLFAVQGDGDATQLMVEAELTKGETHISSPRLTFLRGEEARFIMGDEGGELIEMSITPLP